MTSSTKSYTANDLANLADDGQSYELVRGELRTMTPARFEHGVIGLNLAMTLRVFVKANKMGKVVNADTGFFIESKPDTVRAPDVAFVSQKRIAKLGVPKKFFPGPPDLAVEVVSPSDPMDEVIEKAELWIKTGTEMVWVVSPDKKIITVIRKEADSVLLTDKDILQGEPTLPGFQIPVQEIFS